MYGQTVSAVAEPSFPEFALHGLADFRYQHSDAQQGWVNGGLGAFRDGGENDRLRISEAALVLQGRLWDWSGTATAKYAHGQENPVDLTEAFLQYRPVSTSPWRFGARIGMFFPPISLENNGIAWSSPYTLTSSAINTWVGEELKTFGGEAYLTHQLKSGDRLSVFAAGLANNDTAGTLLTWRGWSLHDYEATLQDSFPIPEGIGLQKLFPRQAALTRPFVEVDGRPGYYAGFSAERPDLFKFRALYYDNRANPAAVEKGQFGWLTQFWSLGFKTELPWDLTLIGQGMTGRTSMGRLRDGKRPFDVGYWAASILLSKASGIHRISMRHDQFGTDENDRLPQDDNRERGYAFTANYNLTLAQQHQLNFEVTHTHKDRSARIRLGQAPNQEETLWQVAYRLFF
jgi:hypothetical protein